MERPADNWRDNEPQVEPVTDSDRLGFAPEQLVRIGLRYRRVLLALPMGLAAVVFAVSLLKAPTFTAEASFIPELGDGGSSALSSLANRFGVMAPGTDPRQSADFYAYLLRSDAVLREVVTDSFELKSENGSTRRRTLVDFFEAEGETQRLRVVEAMRELRGATAISVGSPPGGVRIAVTTADALLSFQVVEAFLARLQALNTSSRQGRARQEREFLEERLDSTRAELHTAQQQLQDFLSRNRSYSEFSEARFQHGRLERNVALHQAHVASLQEALEQAHVQEIRNTPLIDIVEPPVVPARRDSRRIVMKTFVAGLVGAMIALLFIAVMEMWRLVNIATKTIQGSASRSETPV